MEPGGALANAQGELVGINAMLYSQTGSFYWLWVCYPYNNEQGCGRSKKIRNSSTCFCLVHYPERISINIKLTSKKTRQTDADLDFGVTEGIIVLEVPVAEQAVLLALKKKTLSLPLTVNLSNLWQTW